MKAHINGITIEGTADEILEYQEKFNKRKNNKYHLDIDDDKIVKDEKPLKYVGTGENPYRVEMNIHCGGIDNLSTAKIFERINEGLQRKGVAFQ